MCPVCVSVLLSRTVLSELYQEKLVTNDEVKMMKGEGWYLSDRVVVVQCTKPSEVVTKTANVLDKYGHNEEARHLRGWWCRQATQQWTQCTAEPVHPIPALTICWWPHLTHAVWGTCCASVYYNASITCIRSTSGGETTLTSLLCFLHMHIIIVLCHTVTAEPVLLL